MDGIKSHDQRVQEQIAQYQGVERMHGQLSDIFYYWQQTHFRPKFVQVTGCQNFIEFYGSHLNGALAATGLHEIISIGSGDAETEVNIAKWLKNRSCQEFRIIGLELSPHQIRRAWERVDKAGLRDHFDFIETDCNTWEPSGRLVAGFMAHHALHHVQNLEHLFEAIRETMHAEGTFVTFDVVGRNGHMRWPEALQIIERIWAFLPPEKKYHHLLKVTDLRYENRDCSTAGFEGIRSQDILPLLLERFHFRTFLGFGNLVDVFTSRGFGPNWDANEPRDRALIDFIQSLDELLVDLGQIKPTRMCAAMALRPVEPRIYRHWTPAFCVRAPDQGHGRRREVVSSPLTAYKAKDLAAYEALLQRLAPQIGELGQHALNADKLIGTTSEWYLGLLDGVLKRQGMLNTNRPLRILEIGAYRHIVGYMLAAKYAAEVTLFDLAADDLRVGRQIALEQGYRGSVESVSGDFHELPFSDAYFDVVFISASIHHTRTPEKVIGEAMRVLADGGIFYSQREPARRLFCFYGFVANRPSGYRPFERRLFERDMLRIFSSPFPGARNAEIFGRVENDQIPLDFYLETYGKYGEIVEEIVYHDGLLTALDRQILERLSEPTEAIEAFIATRVHEESRAASALIDDRDRLLGFCLPDEQQIVERAAQVAAALKALPHQRGSKQWYRAMGRIFGAVLRFVVRRARDDRRHATEKFRTTMECRDGVYRDPAHSRRMGLDLELKMIPDLQTASPEDLMGNIFPANDWDFVRGPAGGVSMYTRGPSARLLLNEDRRPRMAVVRYRTVTADGQPCKVRFECRGGSRVDDLVPHPEDRFVRLVAPAGPGEINLAITDLEGQPAPESWRVSVSVFQVIPILH